MTTVSAFDSTKYPLFTLTKGKKSIRLYSMIHIAPAEFFEARQAAWDRDYRAGRAIHIEGMRGVPFDLHALYKKIADLLGCEVQPLPRVPFEVHDMTYQEMGLWSRLRLQIVYRMLKAAPWALKQIGPTQAQEALYKGTSDDKSMKYLRFLLDRRNKRAVASALNTPRNVSMVWGAMHIPGIISLLQEEGYSLVK